MNATPNPRPERNTAIPRITLLVLVGLILALLYIGYESTRDDTGGAEELTKVPTDTSSQQPGLATMPPELIAPEAGADSTTVPTPVDLSEAATPAEATAPITDEPTDLPGEEGADRVKAPVDKTAKRTDEATVTRPTAKTTASAGRSTSAATGTKPAAVAVGGSAYRHTIKAGETFYGVANRYNLKASTLKALNPDVPEGSVKAGVTRLNVRVQAVHTVGAGDVLRVVAAKYGITKEALMEANYKTKDMATRGEKLVIPMPSKQ
jgi:LysM repeat protein